MDKEKLLFKLQHLLLHSVRETIFYDQATDEVPVPELKSVFAKYLWLRGEHLIGIRSFLTGPDQPPADIHKLCGGRGNFWKYFVNAVKNEDFGCMLRCGLITTKLTLHKYQEVLKNLNKSDRLYKILNHHYMEIKNVHEELSRLAEVKQHSLR